jgi:tRNA (adenine37-N6)-methyltransferase
VFFIYFERRFPVFELNPIGYVRNSQKEMYQLPYQIGVLGDLTAEIHLEKSNNFELALDELAGFERIWVIFLFHKANNWKPKINPPRGGQKRGLFSTRSPHRPNPIGMSAVKLLAVDGLKLIIEDHDLLDGTPVLDIKPYLPYVDSYQDAACGWLEDVAPSQVHDLSWVNAAENKRVWLQQNGVDLLALVEVSLKLKPYPAKGNRVSAKGGFSELAVKTWRLLFSVTGDDVRILDVYSGYNDEYLKGEKVSRWDDVALHLKFNKVFSS